MPVFKTARFKTFRDTCKAGVRPLVTKKKTTYNQYRPFSRSTSTMYIINKTPRYNAPRRLCKGEFQPFNRSYSQLVFFNFCFTKKLVTCLYAQAMAFYCMVAFSAYPIFFFWRVMIEVFNSSFRLFFFLNDGTPEPKIAGK